MSGGFFWGEWSRVQFGDGAELHSAPKRYGAEYNSAPTEKKYLGLKII